MAITGVLGAAGITFRQLMLFDAVGRHGSVTSAAGEFGLSQPAATQSLAALQDRAGLILLERRGRQSVVTAAGEALRERLGPILARIEQGLAAIGVESPRGAAWNLTHGQLAVIAAIRIAGSLERALAGLAMPRRAALRTIRTLEELAGSPLVETARGETGLTGAGIMLADHLGRVPREIDLVLNKQAGAGVGPPPNINLGVTADPGTAGLDRAIIAHLVARPASGITMIEGNRADLVARLLLGEIDLIVCHFPPDRRDDCDWHVLGRSTFSIVARQGHPLAGRANVPLHDLAGYDWLLGPVGTERRRAFDVLFAGRAQPPCRLVSAAAPLMTKVLGATDALTLMTDREIAPRTHLIARIAHTAPRIAVTLGWIGRSGWQPDADGQDLVARLTAILADPADSDTPSPGRSRA